MIRVPRDASAPEALPSSAVVDAEARAAEFFASAAPKNQQQTFEFAVPADWQREVRVQLENLFLDRCAYCSVAWPPSQLNIDHFRPRQGAVAADGTSSLAHYYWLAFEWANLYLACRACNAAKGNKFPVFGERARPGTFGTTLTAELPGLVDPCGDNPEDYFAYLPSGQVVSHDPRGMQTIDVLALNRSDLVSERRRVAADAVNTMQRCIALMERGDYDACREDLTALFDTRASLAAVRRQFAHSRVHLRRRQFEQVFEQSPGDVSLNELAAGLRRLTNGDLRSITAGYLGRSELELPVNNHYSARAWAAALEPSPGTHSPRGGAPYYRLKSTGIRSIHIRNFLGISDLDLSFSHGDGPGAWTMLLGENGSGKTSLLKAIAVALASDEDLEKARIRPAAVLRSGVGEGSVTVTLAAGEGVAGRLFARGSTTFERVGITPGARITAYGATRLLPSHSARGSQTLIPGIGNLFNPRLSLPGTRTWIPSLSEDEFNSVARSLRRFLFIDDPKTFFVRDRNGQILRAKNGQTIKLGAMSAGNQTLAALALDLMRSRLTEWDSLESAEGVVLIDEIGAHLHPSWQMRIVDAIRAAMPRIQVVATTHDPLCLRGLRDGEVRLLTAGRDGHVSATSELPPIEGLTVDQLLTSEHFGLNSTIDPRVEGLFEEYYELLAIEHPSAEQSRRVLVIRDELDSRYLMGQTRRERLLLEAADSFIAAESTASADAELQTLRADAQAALRAVWEEGLA